MSQNGRVHEVFGDMRKVEEAVRTGTSFLNERVDVFLASASQVAPVLVESFSAPASPLHLLALTSSQPSKFDLKFRRKLKARVGLRQLSANYVPSIKLQLIGHKNVQVQRLLSLCNRRRKKNIARVPFVIFHSSPM